MKYDKFQDFRDTTLGQADSLGQAASPGQVVQNHCVTRSVRRARLPDEGMDRKEWIENRLKELAEILGISVAGFAVLDNHLYLLVRLDPAMVENWSDEDVIRRGARLFPPRDKMRRPLEVSEDWVRTGRPLGRFFAATRAWSELSAAEAGPTDRSTAGRHPAVYSRQTSGEATWGSVSRDSSLDCDGGSEARVALLLVTAV